MALQISVTSTEIIKPSSPTPHHLRHHTLSIIDQYVPAAKVCCILFYPVCNDMVCSEPTSILKSSLSKTLSDFYPLAGKISDNKSIECNDEGVKFTETRVIGRKLDQVVSDAMGEEIDQLLPEDGFYDAGPKVLLSIQLNKFDCGGIALGICVGHKASDASSLSLFQQNWAACARGDHDKTVCPKYDVSALLPQRECLIVPEYPAGELSKKVVSRRFVFSASNIAELKAECTRGGNTRNRTRVEVIIALIWRSAMTAVRTARADIKPKSQALIAVNLRKKFFPPLSNHYVGNLAAFATAIYRTENVELDCLAETINVAIANVDREFLKQLQDNEEPWARITESFRAKDLEFFCFSSWCRFPLFETDFGWGKPSWTSCAGLVPNVAILMDTKDGEGVEAWVALNEEEMAIFEVDPSIVAFTSKAANSSAMNSDTK